MRRAVFVLMAAFALIPYVAFGSDKENFQRARPLDGFAELLLEQGQKRSTTFARLLREVERSNVIVYVEVRSETAIDESGALHFAASSDGQRYLRVRIDTGTTSIGLMLARQLELIAILGHELQHVLEVAADPTVDSVDDFALLYHTIGLKLHRDTFDTLAAQRAGAQVLTELQDGSPADMAPAAAPARSTSTAPSSTTTTTVSNNAMGVVTPAVTEGPYFVNERLNRSDL